MAWMRAPLLLAFGLSFQLPVVLSLGGLAGLIDSKMLRTGRRYAIVAVFEKGGSRRKTMSPRRTR